jgi:hypothetical protein
MSPNNPSSPLEEVARIESNVRVSIRIRPVPSDEKKIVHVLDDDCVQIDSSSVYRWFELDSCFDADATQQDVYVRSGAQQAVCQDLFKGFNCTLMAYGQTGSGKTFTMGTSPETSDDGIIQKASADLFRNIIEKCDGNVEVGLSYIEIYNEEIRDLMVDENQASETLKIRETLNGEIYVKGLRTEQVASSEAICQFMEVGSKRRVVASTKMNAASSRSHALCVLSIKGVLEDSTKFESKLTLVDLAGSEKLSRTGAEGKRMQEGININKGLFVLGQVISALSEQRPKRQRKPPYRDSKLTRLLQDSIGGNSRTIMIACVSGADDNMEETTNTLRYATQARNIKNTVSRNIIRNISPEEAAKLERDNHLLQKKVKTLQDTIDGMLLTTESTLEASSIPSMVERNDTGHFSSSVASTVDTDNDAAIDDNIDNDVKISDLERTIEKMHRRLSRAKSQAKASAVELPALKLQVEVMEEELAEANDIKLENESMYQQLNDLKVEAASSTLAANKLLITLEEMKMKNEQNKEQTSKIGRLAEEGNGWSVIIVTILLFQLILTSAGFNQMAYYQNSSIPQNAALEVVERIMKEQCN